MAAREALAERVRAALAHIPRVAEKTMFGGITFMVNGKMCISAGHHRLMCRIDPELHETAIARSGVRTVRMKGRAYRGFVYVREEAVASRRDLHYWGDCALASTRGPSPRADEGRNRARVGPAATVHLVRPPVVDQTRDLASGAEAAQP